MMCLFLKEIPLDLDLDLLALLNNRATKLVQFFSLFQVFYSESGGSRKPSVRSHSVLI